MSSCPECQKELKHNRKFCDRTCYLTYLKNRKSTIRICVICGTPWEAKNRYQRFKGKTCSERCLSTFRLTRTGLFVLNGTSRERVIELYETYHSWEQVAKELGISRTAVRNYLSK